MKRIYYFILGIIVALSLTAFGKKIADNVLKLGQGNTDNKEIIANTGASNLPALQYNVTTGKWEFSNDGIGFKDIGSGAGGAGGQNFFTDNPDAEAGTNNWTNTGGGTFVTFSATPINGDNSFRWDASAQNDVLRTDQVEIPEKFKGQACEVNFVYTGGTSDLVKPQVVDSSNVKLPGATFENQVDGTDFLQIQTGIVQRTIFFICPSSGTIAFEFNQTEVGNPAVMDFDDVFIGELIGLQTTVANLDWTSYTPTISAGFGTPTGISFKFKLDNGDMLIKGFFTSGTIAASVGSFSMPAGFTIKNSEVIGSLIEHGGSAWRISATGVIYDAGNTLTVFPDGTDVNNIFIGIRSATNTTLAKNNVNTYLASTDSISLKVRIPLVEVAASPVKIFTAIPKVAEQINTFHAIFTSAGVTTSENVNFIEANCTNPGTGNYVCTYVNATFSVSPSVVCSTNLSNSFNCSVTASSASSFSINIRNTVSDLDTNQIFAVTVGKQGVDFKTAVAHLILVNQVETTKKSGIRIESCRFNANGGTPSIDTASTLCPGWISNVVDDGVGDYEVNIIVGIFSSSPVCNVTADDFLGSQALCIVDNITATQLDVICSTASTAAQQDADFNLTCTGVR